MESAEVSDRFVPGPKEKMIGVAEDDLRVQVIQKISREDAFHGCLGAYGHENRGLNVAVSSVENARPGAGSGADGLELESRHRSYCRVALAKR